MRDGNPDEAPLLAAPIAAQRVAVRAHQARQDQTTIVQPEPTGAR